jgi:hypothetical protein
MSSNVKNAETFMKPSVFVPTAKTRDPALPAGEMKVKNNCPSFHPPDPVQGWIWGALRLQVHAAHRAAVFREPDNRCGRVPRLLTKGNINLWKPQPLKKKGKI